MGIFGTTSKPKSAEPVEPAPKSAPKPEKEPEPEQMPDLLGKKGYREQGFLEKYMAKRLPDRSPLGQRWGKKQKKQWLRESILSDTGEYFDTKERAKKIRTFQKMKQELSLWKSKERKELDARIAALKATKGDKAA